MLLNAELNDTAQKMLCVENFNMCERVGKIMANTGST